MATRSKSDPVGRRRLNPDQRRRELLEAAVRVLRQRGPAHCRVEDITAEAGTAKGNFYRYFPTWDDLLIAVRDYLMENYAQGVRQRVSADNGIDWWTVLEEETDRFLDFQLELGGLHDAVFHGPASRTQPIDATWSGATLAAALLTGGTTDGTFADIDIGPTARLFFYVLHGAADDIRAGADHDETRSAVLTVFRRTLGPLPAVN
jgi:AcrR family transcriptional regulator